MSSDLEQVVAPNNNGEAISLVLQKPLGIHMAAILLRLLLSVMVVALSQWIRDISWLWVQVYVLIGIALIPLLWEMYKGVLDVFDPKNLFTLYLVVQFAGFTVYRLLGGEPMMPWLTLTNPSNVSDYTNTLTLAIIGLLAFQIGYDTKLGKTLGRALPSFGLWRGKRVTFVVTATTLIGCSAAFVFFGSYGGIIGFLQNIAMWRATASGVGYLVFPMATMLPMASIVYFIYLCKTQPTAQRIRWALIFFLLTLLPPALMGFRIVLVPPLLQMLMVWHYFYRPFSIRRLLMFGALFLVLLSGYGMLRSNIEMSTTNTTDPFVGESAVDQLLSSALLRTRSTDVVTTTVTQLDRTGAYAVWWASFVESATIWVPKSLWKNKPVPQGTMFGENVMIDFFVWRDGYAVEHTGGVSPTPIGYFYWQMGWLGVLIGMFVLGLGAMTISSYRKYDAKSPSRLLLFSVVASTYPILAESPQDALNGLVMKLVFTFGLLWLLTGRKKYPVQAYTM